MSADRAVFQPKIMGGITSWGQYRCETVQDIIIAPANGLPVIVNNAAHAGEEIKDSILAANETDSAEAKDTFVIASLSPSTMHASESVTIAGGPSASEVTIEDMTDPVISHYADMMSVDAHDINNYPLYRFIDKWYGTPYRWGGDDNDGIDCSAFSQRLYGNVYTQEIARTSRQQHKHCERIKNTDDAEEGDLIFFRINRFRISHVGVYLANGYFVHASRSQGVVISSLDNKYWRRRYAGCGRVEREEKSGYESDVAAQ